jgi:hypothetical protein
MTHEPIRVIHFSPHITWQGTQAELDAMLAEGCPVGSASEIIAACWWDVAEAKAYAAELERKLAKAVEQLKKIAEHDIQKIALTALRANWKDLDAHRLALTEIAKHDLQAIATSAIASLKGDKP